MRIIKLNPNSYEEAVHNLHLDDNNRLNPDGEGWVVRVWLELSDDPNSYMILREDKDDPSTESRISMPHNRQLVIDSQRLWHAAWHPGPEPRCSARPRSRPSASRGRPGPLSKTERWCWAWSSSPAEPSPAPQ